MKPLRKERNALSRDLRTSPGDDDGARGGDGLCRVADGESVNERQREGGEGELGGEHRERKGWGKGRENNVGWPRGRGSFDQLRGVMSFVS